MTGGVGGDLVAAGETQPRIGRWDHALGAPNLEDAAFPHALSWLAAAPGARMIERAYRQRLRLKSWQYMTAASADWLVAFVVGTAGIASNGFVYAVELATGRVWKRLSITPLRRGTELSPTSARGAHTFSGGGLRVQIDNELGGRRFAAHIACVEVGADLAFTSAPDDEHFAICTPLGEGHGARWNYTHKFGAFAVTGSLTVEGRRISMDGASGTVDFTKSYALRHAVWKWIALAGRTRDGRALGINLVQPTPDAPISENCAWLAGARIPLEAVTIGAGGEARADRLELHGEPIATVEQRLDVPLLRHRLIHATTRFAGTLRTPAGETVAFERLAGIAEDNDTWW